MKKLLLCCIVMFLVIICGCSSPQDTCPNETSCSGLNLVLVKLQPNDRNSYSDPVIFSGTVKNIDNCTVKEAIVGINFYDEQGAILDKVDTTIRCINPGETRDFNLRYSGPKLEAIRNFQWFFYMERES